MSKGFQGLLENEEVLVLILIVLLFNPCCDGLFNTEILTVIILLWLIAGGSCFKECC